MCQRIACYLLLILMAPWAYGATVEPIVLDPGVGAYTVGPRSHVLVDATRDLDRAGAEKAWDAGAFQPETAKDPNYGFTSNAYWYRFAARNNASTPKEWFFGMEYPLVNHIDLYYKGPQGEWVHRDTGNAFEFDHRDLKSRYIYLRMEFAPNETKDIFVRLQTDGSSEFRMVLKDLPTIYRDDHDVQFFLGAAMGLVLVLAAYYLLMTLNTRQVDIFWLSVFLFTLFIFRMAVNGSAFEYLWPLMPAWAHAVMAASVPAVFGTAMISTYYFLPLHQHPRFRLAARITIALNLSLMVLSYVLPYRMLKVYTLLGILTATLILSISLYSQIKGFRPARYFVYAWLAMIVGSITFGVQKLGLIPVTFLGTYGPELATVMQAVLMALGVSDKINDTNKQLQIAQAEALKAQIETNRLQEEMNTQLERQVQERTEALWKQTKGMSVMLDNINQGICTVDADLRVQPQHSRRMSDILGQNDIEGQPLGTLLFDHCHLPKEVRDLMHSTVSTAMGSEMMQFEINEHLLPRHLHYTRQRSRKMLEMDWAGIEDKDGLIEKLLVSIRDVTEIRQAEEAAATKQKELEAIGRILDLSASKFRRFVKSASILIEEARQKLDLGITRSAWQIVLRNIHTVKGNARTYGLLDVSSAVHELENELFAIDPERITRSDIGSCMAGLNRIEDLIGFYQRIHDDKLKRGAVVEFESLIVQASRMMTEVWPELNAEKRKRYRQTLERFDALNTNSFKKVLQPLIDSLPGLAHQLNKTAPQVRINGQDFFIDPDSLNFFEDIFVHMMRNSLDHGFMLGDEGCITIELKHGKDSTEIVYYDNGRGLNLPALQKKAREKNMIPDGADDITIARTIFEAGISSAKVVTEISGRGVGMDAVKACIERLHGRIDLRLMGEAHIVGFQRCEFRITLPAQSQALQALDQDQAA